MALGSATRVNLGSAKLHASQMPETIMLWVIIGLELVAMGSLRHYFRRHHGG